MSKCNYVWKGVRNLEKHLWWTARQLDFQTANDGESCVAPQDFSICPKSPWLYYEDKEDGWYIERLGD